MYNISKVSTGFSGSGTNSAKNFLKVLHSVLATLPIFYSVTALRLFLLKKISYAEANIFSNIFVKCCNLGDIPV